MTDCTEVERDVRLPPPLPRIPLFFFTSCLILSASVPALVVSFPRQRHCRGISASAPAWRRRDSSLLLIHQSSSEEAFYSSDASVDHVSSPLLSIRRRWRSRPDAVKPVSDVRVQARLTQRTPQDITFSLLLLFNNRLRVPRENFNFWCFRWNQSAEQATIIAHTILS